MRVNFECENAVAYYFIVNSNRRTGKIPKKKPRPEIEKLNFVPFMELKLSAIPCDDMLNIEHPFPWNSVHKANEKFKIKLYDAYIHQN